MRRLSSHQQNIFVAAVVVLIGAAIIAGLNWVVTAVLSGGG